MKASGLSLLGCLAIFLLALLPAKARPPAPPAPSGAEAALKHLRHFHSQRQRYVLGHQRDWERLQLTSFIGLSANTGGPVVNGLVSGRMNSALWQALHNVPPRPKGQPLTRRDQFLLDYFSRNYLMAQDYGPAPSLYLAIRAARKGLAKQSDARTHLLLADAYFQLLEATREGPRVRGLVPYAEAVRHTQIACSLNRALRSKPTPKEAQAAHWLLARLYSRREHFELQVHHEAEYLRLSRKLRSLVGVSPDDQPKAFDVYEKRIKELRQQLDDKLNKYELDSAGKSALVKAEIALRAGLSNTAIDVLLKAPIEELFNKRQPQPSGAVILLSLLLATGRLDEVREALTPPPGKEADFKREAFGAHPLGLPGYEWFQVLCCAGRGDYAQADKYLQELIGKVARSSEGYEMLAFAGVISRKEAKGKKGPASDVAALACGHLLLEEAARAAQPSWAFHRRLILHMSWTATSEAVRRLITREADLHALRAWLAVEAGDLARGRKALADLSRLTTIDRGKGRRSVVVVPSAALAELCRELLAGEGKRPR
jgi:hypothetical protein